MATEPSSNRAERYIRYTLIILGAFLVVFLVFLIAQYQVLRREQIAARHHGPLPVADANFIRPWMTFDYVNKLFMLPPDYLQMQLHITDRRYPRITLSSYASSNHLVQSVFVAEVEYAVGKYSTSTTPL
jgi:hypothetical protein